MRTRLLSVAAALAIVCAAPVTAQIHTATPYGRPGLYQTPLDPSMTLQLNQPTATVAELSLQGGFADDPAALLVSAGQANTPFGPAATIYVAAPAFPIVGVFDPTGVFTVTFDPTMPALFGATLYFQGVDLMPSGMQLSNGLELVFHS